MAFFAKNRELIFAEHIAGNEVCQACCTRINLPIKASKLLQHGNNEKNVSQYPSSGQVEVSYDASLLSSQKL